MGPSQSIFFFLSLALSSLFLFCSSSSHTRDLVFKGCSSQSLTHNDVYKKTLNTLLDALVSKSSSANFSRSSSGYGSLLVIDGTFQCRGDLSNKDCHRCVRKTPKLARKICGQAIAARVQLSGCYLRYESSGFPQRSGTDFLYNVCGSNRVDGDGFDGIFSPALGEMANGVGNLGFYEGVYWSVYMLGQCEGDLSGGDCVNCVKNAIDQAKSRCGNSISAQIYLQKCFISYTFYPNGVPEKHHHSSSSFPAVGTWIVRNGKTITKTVAIVLGVIAFVVLLACFILALKSSMKKKPYAYKSSG
ncbi:hypothetical protein OROGR_019508 [Orobanche gracilis]